MLKLKNYFVVAALFVVSLAHAESKDVYYPATSDNSLQHGILFTSREVKPRAALLFAHGMQSHAEWLRASGVGDSLAEAGIMVFAYDRRGSGQSTSMRGHADSAQELLTDMNDAILSFRGEMDSALELHVMANCFGARIVVPYLVAAIEQGKNPFSTLTLIAPSTHMTALADYSAGEKIGILLRPKQSYVPTPLQDEWFVSKGEGLDWIRNDELGLREVTAGFLKVARKLTKTMDKNIYGMKFPLMIFTANNDVMVDSKAVKAELFDPYQGPKRLVQVDGEHSLEFGSAGPQPLIQGTIDWILGSGRAVWKK